MGRPSSAPPGGASFNLVDEPWIPCLRDAHTPPILLSLRAVFDQAPSLWQIADPSPVVTISLYRLLLAILHRSLRGPRDAAEWARIHDYGLAHHAWDPADLAAIDRYLTTWRLRFDLFDAEHPFYQTPGVSTERGPDAATVLTHERASGRNGSLLFDHTTPERAWLAPAAAARALLAQHNFAVGGLIAYDSAHEPIANKYVSMAPLLKATICLVQGASLFETLLLNSVGYNPADAQPFPFHGDDQPAWERDEPPAPVERIPDGYVDLLTWQSRRIRLIPGVTPSGPTIVEQAYLMKGYQLSPSFDRWTSETMLTFKKNPKASSGGGEPWYTLSLQSDRVVWRDSHALLQASPEVGARPKTLTWLHGLMLQGYLDERRILPLDVYGMIPNQADIEDWRHESLPLPLALLNDNALVEVVGEAVALAESLGRLLTPYAITITHNGKPHPYSSPVAVLAEALLVGTSGRSADPKARERLVESFGAPIRYWAQLDTPFRAFITALPHDRSTDPYGQPHYGQSARTEWARQVAAALHRVFQQVVADLDTSARALRAVALAQSRLAFCLAALLPPIISDGEGAERATAATATNPIVSSSTPSGVPAQ